MIINWFTLWLIDWKRNKYCIVLGILWSLYWYSMEYPIPCLLNISDSNQFADEHLTWSNGDCVLQSRVRSCPSSRPTNPFARRENYRVVTASASTRSSSVMASPTARTSLTRTPAVSVAMCYVRLSWSSVNTSRSQIWITIVLCNRFVERNC